MTNELVKVGAFCPYEDCEDHGKTGTGNVRKYGKTDGGVQRYQCKRCGRTFTATRGTMFYRRRVEAHEIIDVLAMLAEGMRISSVTRVKGFKEDTILDWLREAARHAEAIEAVLLRDYRIGPAQIDALWAYVGHKGEKGGIPKARHAARSGAAP